MTAPLAAVPKDQLTMLGVVNAGHFMSHYYSIVLPVLFPLLHLELGVSYVALGFLLTLFHVASGASQLPAGFLVDRIGALQVLVGGLALEATAVLLMGLAPGYALLLVLSFVAGLGNAVFHPADYAILAEKVDETRLGRVFSIHTFSGHLGSAAGPVVIGLMLLVFDWRVALVTSGLAGLAVLVWALAIRAQLAGSAKPSVTEARDTQAAAGRPLLFTTPLLLMFLFFIATSLTSTGVQSFSVTAFHEVQGMEASAAGGVLSAYLFASAFGVLLGGVLADRTRRHDLVAIFAFLFTAGAMFAIGSFLLPLVVIALLYTLTGLLQGAVRPARDMMVRAATPPGGMGRAFGFVSTGISAGSAIAPMVFGWIVDHGDPRWIFHAMAGFMLLGVISVLASHRVAGRPMAGNGSQAGGA